MGRKLRGALAQQLSKRDFPIFLLMDPSPSRSLSHRIDLCEGEENGGEQESWGKKERYPRKERKRREY